MSQPRSSAINVGVARFDANSRARMRTRCFCRGLSTGEAYAWQVREPWLPGLGDVCPCLTRFSTLEPRRPGGGELDDLCVGVAGLGEDLGRVLAEPGRRRSVPDSDAVGGQRQGDGPESSERLEDPQRLRLLAVGNLGHILD